MMYASKKRVALRCSQVFMVFLVLIILNIVRYKVLPYTPPKPEEGKIDINDHKKHLTFFNHYTWKNTTWKKILVWTPFFRNYFPWVNGVREAINQCPASCVVTIDREELDTSDAIYFHASDLWKHIGLKSTVYQEHIEMPPTRRPDQVWVLINMEPLPNLAGTIPFPMNWTMHYRRESTLFSPYGIKDIPAEERHSKRDYFSEKTMFASTLVSNCIDQAQRYRIIYELKKYIDLDDFGDCSGNTVVTCPRKFSTLSSCGIELLAKYKFYLAFENSICKDYITEKFWNALVRRQIPVIATLTYNTDLLPKNSFINVFDFPTIKDVAQYMIKVGNNRTLYNSFFDWISTYKVKSTSSHCELCIALHSNMTSQSYNTDAWLEDDTCHRNTFFPRIGSSINRFLFDIGTKWL